MAIEKTTTWASVVSSLAEAWSFVMENLDGVGPEPRITVSPMWVYSELEQGELRFEVSVSGTVTEGSS